MASVDELVKAMGKEFGHDIVSSGVPTLSYDRIPTGFFDFDIGIGGGFPRGKASIVYGTEGSAKTTIVLRAIAQHQVLYPDQRCVFIDVEGHYDPEWGAILGVDNQALVYVMPESAEQVVDIVEAFLCAEDVGVVGLDSVAAMITTNEVQSSADKAIVGGTGLAINKLYRKSTLALNKARRAGRKPTLICINQIRFKIGVMMGDPECLHADTPIPFVDGRSFTIREIVDNDIDGQVWGYNPDTGEFTKEHIISRHYNGEANDGDFITMFAEGVDTKNGVFSLTASYTHKIYTDRGWVRLGDLKGTDKVYAPYPKTTNPLVKALLTGMFVGDSTLTNPNGGNKYGLRFQDKTDPEYSQWKADLLRGIYPIYEQVDHRGTMQYSLSPQTEIGVMFSQYHKRDPKALFDNYHPLALAVWLMDDGHLDEKERYTLCIGRAKYDAELRAYVSAKFAQHGFNGIWSASGKNFVFSKESSYKLAREIAVWVPPVMARKLPSGFSCKGLTTLGSKQEVIAAFKSSVIRIDAASPRKYRQRGLYDLHVSGPNTYLAGNASNGFVVHNTMPGGNAFKFFSSLTVRVYGKDENDKKIHPTLPAWKVISVIVKKKKIPTVARNMEIKMAIAPGNTIPLGHSYDWPSIHKYLREYGLLNKGDKSNTGWWLNGVNYPVLDEIKNKLLTDPQFEYEIKNQLFSIALGILEGGEEEEGNE